MMSVHTSRGGNHMSFLLGSRLSLTLALALPVGMLSGAALHAADPAKKGDSKRVSFQTVDGVEIQGNYYVSPGTKKDACVLLLHNFDPKKGGNSHQDGWDNLAATLQAAGYVVLSFDF